MKVNRKLMQLRRENGELYRDIISLSEGSKDNLDWLLWKLEVHPEIVRQVVGDLKTRSTLSAREGRELIYLLEGDADARSQLNNWNGELNFRGIYNTLMEETA